MMSEGPDRGSRKIKEFVMKPHLLAAAVAAAFLSAAPVVAQDAAAPAYQAAVADSLRPADAFVPNRTAERENPRADALVAAYPNVSRVNGDLDAMSFDQPLDLVFMSQEYHDFHIPRFGVDVAKMNADIFKALKPGGLYVVIDHQAAPGAANSVVETLHRIEGAQLRKEVEAAGFVFDGESTAVANTADDHSLNVFDEAIRGKTDQFVYRFRKPN
jgi:predicted methyltransferase